MKLNINLTPAAVVLGMEIMMESLVILSASRKFYSKVTFKFNSKSVIIKSKISLNEVDKPNL